MSASHLNCPTGTVLERLSAFSDFKAEEKGTWDRVLQLRELCSRPISIRGECASFVQSLAELRDQLALEFAEEETYEATFQGDNAPPSFAQLAMECRAQHRSLYVEISRLVEHAETLLARHQPATIAILIPSEFEVFFHKLERHEWAERELIYSSQSLDHDDD